MNPASRQELEALIRRHVEAENAHRLDRFAVFVPFRDGLMAGERFYYDLDGLLRQLGAVRPTLAA